VKVNLEVSLSPIIEWAKSLLWFALHHKPITWISTPKIRIFVLKKETWVYGVFLPAGRQPFSSFEFICYQEDKLLII